MPRECTQRFVRELGSKQVLTSDHEQLQDYAVDESGLGPYPPDCAVLCESAEQVAAVMRIAYEDGIPVTPRGAGSGKVGGCLPVRGGVVLSTERMTAIREIDGDDLVAVVEPGVITGDLQAAAEEAGYFYPPDPASLDTCSLGGNASTNAGGPRAFKYGVTREYVLGLDLVLAAGERLSVGRRTVKGVTGLDLVAGFVGSEGTLGVATELTLRLLPKPPTSAALLAAFDSLEAAGSAIRLVLGHGMRPSALEIMDRLSIEHVRSSTRFRFPPGASAAVLVEVDGEAEMVEQALMSIGQLLEGAHAREIAVASSPADSRDLWQARRSISKALTAAHRYKFSEDICVPLGAMVEMLRRIEKLGADSGFPAACYGHAGDGNLHVNFLVDEDPKDPQIQARIDDTNRRLFEATIALSGTLSGEHGIGLTKRSFMPLEQSEAELEWQRRLKALWDPRDLLNPGKVLPPR